MSTPPLIYIHAFPSFPEEEAARLKELLELFNFEFDQEPAKRVESPHDTDASRDVMRRTVKIFFRRYGVRDELAYRMADVMRENGYDFVTDVLTIKKKNSDGKMVVIPLPKDRIVMELRK